MKPPGCCFRCIGNDHRFGGRFPRSWHRLFGMTWTSAGKCAFALTWLARRSYFPRYVAGNRSPWGQEFRSGAHRIPAISPPARALPGRAGIQAARHFRFEPTNATVISRLLRGEALIPGVVTNHERSRLSAEFPTFAPAYVRLHEAVGFPCRPSRHRAARAASRPCLSVLTSPRATEHPPCPTPFTL